MARGGGPSAQEVELLEELGGELDLEAVRLGQLTPVFFGSAQNNFGVQLFLDQFLGYSVPPRPRATVDDADVARPQDAAFSGFVFKLQANMDPRHRDKVAFVRVVSGRFDRGMKARSNTIEHCQTAAAVACRAVRVSLSSAPASRR